jgi:hypothetical protein
VKNKKREKGRAMALECLAVKLVAAFYVAVNLLVGICFVHG